MRSTGKSKTHATQSLWRSRDDGSASVVVLNSREKHLLTFNFIHLSYVSKKNVVENWGKLFWRERYRARVSIIMWNFEELNSPTTNTFRISFFSFVPLAKKRKVWWKPSTNKQTVKQAKNFHIAHEIMWYGDVTETRWRKCSKFTSKRNYFTSQHNFVS